MSRLGSAQLTLAVAATAVIVIFVNPPHSGIIRSQNGTVDRAQRGSVKCPSDPGNSLPFLDLCYRKQNGEPVILYELQIYGSRTKETNNKNKKEPRAS